MVAQRAAAHPEEQHAALRRLYLYLALLAAALFLLFSLRDLLDALLSGEPLDLSVGQLSRAIASLVVHGPIWFYHWRVAAQDRLEVERAGNPATLRRWYLVLVQAFSLGVAAFGAIDVLNRLLQLATTTAIGGDLGVGAALAGLIAGLAIWLPHHIWARRLVRDTSPLQADEVRSTLRQVYSALLVAVTAVAALGGLATILYAILLAGLAAQAGRLCSPTIRRRWRWCWWLGRSGPTTAGR